MGYIIHSELLDLIDYKKLIEAQASTVTYINSKQLGAARKVKSSRSSKYNRKKSANTKQKRTSNHKARSLGMKRI